MVKPNRIYPPRSGGGGGAGRAFRVSIGRPSLGAPPSVCLLTRACNAPSARLEAFGPKFSAEGRRRALCPIWVLRQTPACLPPPLWSWREDPNGGSNRVERSRVESREPRSSSPNPNRRIMLRVFFHPVCCEMATSSPKVSMHPKRVFDQIDLSINRSAACSVPSAFCRGPIDRSRD